MSRARIGGIITHFKILSYTCALIITVMMTSCASSDVTRDVTAGIDHGLQNANNMADSLADGSIADTYQNTSQRAKGAIVGTAAGAVGGYLTTGVGVLPGALAGLIFGASYGSYVDQHSSIEDQLRNRGANVIILGDQILIVVPSARIFKPFSSTIKPDAYSTFRQLATLINTYTKSTVKVSAHTAELGSSDVNYALSQAQAESVSKLLQASGVNARMMYAMGYGGSHLVQRNCQDWEGNDNYRIEIAFEKLYV